jgi:tetratricopeptide (TPR) repeat protein
VADDVEALLRQAVPRLRKDDDGAQKIRRKLVKMGLDAWAEGPRRLRALGVTVDKGAHALLDDASVEGLHEQLGDERFVTLFKALKDELADKLAGKKPDAPPPKSASGRVARASSGRAKRATASSASGRVEKKSKTSGRVRRPSGSDRLTMSSREEEGSGSGELAIPDELALPPDEPMLGVPDDEPMSIRFDDDAPVTMQAAPSAAKPAKDEDDDPSRAGDRAVARYRASGDQDDLDDAKKLYTRAAKSAEGDLAKGAARAGLAQVALLAGDAARAKEHAEKALALFPDEPTALRVLLRAPPQG